MSITSTSGNPNFETTATSHSSAFVEIMRYWYTFFNHAAFENSTKIPFLANNNDRKLSRKTHAQKFCFVFNFIPNEFMQTEMKYKRCVRSRGFKCYCLNGRWMERERQTYGQVLDHSHSLGFWIWNIYILSTTCWHSSRMALWINLIASDLGKLLYVLHHCCIAYVHEWRKAF